MDWRHRALCRDEDPELFFPIGTTGPAERQVEEAKAVCRRCAVTSDCLSWALVMRIFGRILPSDLVFCVLDMSTTLAPAGSVGGVS